MLVFLSDADTFRPHGVMEGAQNESDLSSEFKELFIIGNWANNHNRTACGVYRKKTRDAVGFLEIPSARDEKKVLMGSRGEGTTLKDCDRWPWGRGDRACGSKGHRWGEGAEDQEPISDPAPLKQPGRRLTSWNAS